MFGALNLLQKLSLARGRNVTAGGWEERGRKDAMERGGIRINSEARQQSGTYRQSQGNTSKAV